MPRIKHIGAAMALLALPAVSACSTVANSAASQADITASSSQALNKLVRDNPAAAAISQQSRAVLVFPEMVKGGLVVGGAYGEGELRKGGQTTGYYTSFTGSWGLQAGAQSYGYAVFLMNDNAIQYLEESDGWEIGEAAEGIHGDDAAALGDLAFGDEAPEAFVGGEFGRDDGEADE